MRSLNTLNKHLTEGTDEHREPTGDLVSDRLRDDAASNSAAFRFDGDTRHFERDNNSAARKRDFKQIDLALEPVYFSTEWDLTPDWWKLRVSFAGQKISQLSPVLAVSEFGVIARARAFEAFRLGKCLRSSVSHRFILGKCSLRSASPREVSRFCSSFIRLNVRAYARLLAQGRRTITPAPKRGSAQRANVIGTARKKRKTETNELNFVSRPRQSLRDQAESPALPPSPRHHGVGARAPMYPLAFR